MILVVEAKTQTVFEDRVGAPSWGFRFEVEDHDTLIVGGRYRLVPIEDEDVQPDPA